MLSARFKTDPFRCFTASGPAAAGVLRAVLAAAGEDSGLRKSAGLVPVWPLDDVAVAAALVLRVEAAFGLRFVLGNSDPDLLAEGQDLAAILRVAGRDRPAGDLTGTDCLRAADLLSAAVYAVSRVAELNR